MHPGSSDPSHIGCHPCATSSTSTASLLTPYSTQPRCTIREGGREAGAAAPTARVRPSASRSAYMYKVRTDRDCRCGRPAGLRRSWHTTPLSVKQESEDDCRCQPRGRHGSSSSLNCVQLRSTLLSPSPSTAEPGQLQRSTSRCGRPAKCTIASTWPSIHTLRRLVKRPMASLSSASKFPTMLMDWSRTDADASSRRKSICHPHSVLRLVKPGSAVWISWANALACALGISKVLYSIQNRSHITCWIKYMDGGHQDDECEWWCRPSLLLPWQQC